MPEKLLIGKDQLGAAESLLEKGGLVAEDLMAECDRLRARIPVAAAESNLPARPDETAMTDWCCSLIEEVLGC